MYKWALLLCVCLRAQAHDFWLQPNDYWAPANAIIPLTLQVGHGPFRQRSPIPARRITRLQAITPDNARVDLRDRLRLGATQEDGELQFGSAGAYMVVLQTDNQAQ